MMAVPSLHSAVASADTDGTPTGDPVDTDAGVDLATAAQDQHDTAAASRLPTVAFTWDAPWQSMYRNGLPLFEARSLRATAFVISGRAGGSDPGVIGDRFCTWDQIAGLRSASWEISNHTYDHKSLPGLPPAQIRAEIRNGKRALVDRGYATPGFAYPYNRYDGQVQGLAEIYQEYARAGSVGGHGLGPSRT